MRQVLLALLSLHLPYRVTSFVPSVPTKLDCARWIALDPLSEQKTEPEDTLAKKVKLVNDLDKFVWYLSPVSAMTAFASYTETSRAFHNFIDSASGHTWQPVDGGEFISELVKTALGGPVTFGISILFGTLVGLTVSSLYSRQQNIHATLVGMTEKFRELELCVEGFPEPYRQKCQASITRL